MAETSEKKTKEDVLIHQIPKLQTDVREQRKQKSLEMIFHALKRRFEENEPSKP